MINIRIHTHGIVAGMCAASLLWAGALMADYEGDSPAPFQPEGILFEEPETLFPALDLSYAFHDDNDVNLHSWSARIGLGMVTRGPGTSCVEWMFPAMRLFYEESDIGNATRCGYLLSFDYHFQHYDFKFCVAPVRGGEHSEDEHRPPFPFERRMIIGAVYGIEAGFVSTKDLFTPDNEDGFRLGARGRFSGIVAELSGNAAVEFYDERTLYELGVTISPLFRTFLPFGPFIGYRHSSTPGFHENSFVIGFEANF